MKIKKKHLRVLIAYNDTFNFPSNHNIDLISEKAVKDEAIAVYNALKERQHYAEYLPLNNIERDIQKIKKFQPEVIFNLCEGFLGNAQKEMYVAGLWELLGIPYTGNSPLTLGLSQNKIVTKKLLQSKRIPTPIFQVYEQIPKTVMLDFPLIVKPAFEDGSVGITQQSVVNEFSELKKLVENLLAKYEQPVLVESFIQGREFNVSLFGNQPPKILPISEIKFDKNFKEFHQITSYEAKWLKEHQLYKQTPSICPATISDMLRRLIEDTSMQVYRLLMGRDYGRVDIRVDNNNKIYVLEFNPNPDISLDAGYVKSLQAAGTLYEDFIEFLVQQAFNRNLYDSITKNAVSGSTNDLRNIATN